MRPPHAHPRRSASSALSSSLTPSASQKDSGRGPFVDVDLSQFISKGIMAKEVK